MIPVLVKSEDIVKNEEVDIETPIIWTATPATDSRTPTYFIEMLGDGGVVTSSQGVPMSSGYVSAPSFQYIPSTRVHTHATDLHRIQNLTQFPLGYYGHQMGYTGEHAMPISSHHFDPVASTSEEVNCPSMSVMRTSGMGVPHSVPPTDHATATDSAGHITHVLMLYEIGSEDKDYTKKAIESLVKKLKDKRPELDNLIMAITSAGKTPTSCVTIQRSLDGRLQVAGRKGVPHVVYARIWRWPSVSKAELQKLPCCAVTPDNQDFICINPYHYERVVAHTFDMTSARVDHSLGASFGTATPSSQNSTPMFATSMGTAQLLANQSVDPVPMDHGIPYQDWSMSTSFAQINYQSHVSINPAHSQQQQQQQQLVQAIPVADLSMIQIPQMLLGPFPKYWATITYYELDTQVGEPFKALASVEGREVVIDGGMDPLGDRQGRFCLGAISNVHRTEASEKARIHIGQGIRLWWHDEQLWIVIRSENSIFVRSPYLDYCEGKPLGSSVHRFTNYSAPENSAIKLFDLRWAYHQMREQTACERQAVVQQAAAVAGFAPPPSGLSSVPLSELSLVSGADEMQRAFCSIGISFVKGWGNGYNRPTIKDTPCWVEVQLSRPLQILNALLKEGFK
ncbi:unnamed protein product, partial [Mesorhabditis belari]|uniref:Mothers against decapentaplegic homolog n=1 Tax=Mesorhabditis belari TaxID=2138241 RepID=A0AAF3EAC8_9BILA